MTTFIQKWFYDFSIRGKLGSFSHLTRNIGLLSAYIIGAVVEYKIVPCIFIFIPILFAILFSLLPNTPQYHLHKGNPSVMIHLWNKRNYPVLRTWLFFFCSYVQQKAEKSLKFYKGIKGDNIADQALFKAEFERLKSLANEQKVEENLQWSDFCK